MVRVLVISDNYTLMNHFKSEAHREDISNLADFNFRYSKKNKNAGDLIKLGMAPVDLKDDGECKKITEDFDIVLSLHCKQIFPAELVNKVTCINFHPGLNPYNRGWYPQVFSLINKNPIGVTVHLMDEQIDHGKILYQEEVKQLPTDTSLSLYNRVIELEKNILTRELKNILTGNYAKKTPDGEGNYNSIEDFRKLCNLNLGHVGTLGEHIDLLRALTHGSYKNAYFSDNGDKIYVSIELRVET